MSMLDKDIRSKILPIYSYLASIRQSRSKVFNRASVNRLIMYDFSYISDGEVMGKL